MLSRKPWAIQGTYQKAGNFTSSETRVPASLPASVSQPGSQLSQPLLVLTHLALTSTPERKHLQHGQGCLPLAPGPREIQLAQMIVIIVMKSRPPLWRPACQLSPFFCCQSHLFLPRALGSATPGPPRPALPRNFSGTHLLSPSPQSLTPSRLLVAWSSHLLPFPDGHPLTTRLTNTLPDVSPNPVTPSQPDSTASSEPPCTPCGPAFAGQGRSPGVPRPAIPPDPTPSSMEGCGPFLPPTRPPSLSYPQSPA